MNLLNQTSLWKYCLFFIITLSLRPMASGQTIRLNLMDARADAPLLELQTGLTIDLGLVGDALNVQALSDTEIEGVVFGYNDREVLRTERTEPYALAGDAGGDFFDWTPALGSNLITVRPILIGGERGPIDSIFFDVIDSRQGPRPADGDGSITVDGTLQKWHTVTLSMEGPFHFEDDDEPNPFLDYRLEVTFTNGAASYTVPGYFAADGDAANTSATSGTVWRAHFTPDRTGTWTYRVSFRQGDGVAVSDDPTAGTPVAILDGQSGSFTIDASDKALPDLRAQGRLEYVGKRYRQFAETGTYFLKGGTDSPENLLAYEDFDRTGNFKEYRKSYAPHANDWQPGNPSWGDNRGTELIGAINYLASEKLNSMSFLTFSYGGDDRNVFPHVDPDLDFRHFDCSKLDQWGIVFEYAGSKGIHLNFKTQEKENDSLLDGGELGIERKLYLRELIARYAHHLAVTWNIGEENQQTDAQRKAIAQFLSDHDPYGHLIVVHSLFNDFEDVYGPMLGNQSALTGMSLQANWKLVHQLTLEWSERSAEAGKPWVIGSDEQNPSSNGVPPDDNYLQGSIPNISKDDIRQQVLWGNLLAGGEGVEYYFGYDLPETDVTAQDFRSRDTSWDYVHIAREFFYTYLPFDEMKTVDSLVREGFCFIRQAPGNDTPPSMYVAYFPDGGEQTLEVQDTETTYRVRWFDPRRGGGLQTGTVDTIRGEGEIPSKRPLGLPPYEEDQDWVAFVTQVNPNDTNSLPVADFTFTVDGLQVSLDASASLDPDGSIVSYQWNLGDGTTASGETIQHTYLQSGNFLVTLKVIDNDGAAQSTTQQISVEGIDLPNQPPIAAIIADPITGDAPLTVRFDAGNSTDPDGQIAQYVWLYQDGSPIENEAQTIHTFERIGAYNVTLIVFDDEGLAGFTTQLIQVNGVNQPPIARIESEQLEPGNALQVRLDASNSEDPDGFIAFYDWDFGDGTTAAGSNFVHQYPAPGTYNVRLTITDNLGEQATVTESIMVTSGDCQDPITMFATDFPYEGTNFIPLEVLGEEILGVDTEQYFLASISAPFPGQQSCLYDLTFHAVGESTGSSLFLLEQNGQFIGFFTVPTSEAPLEIGERYTHTIPGLLIAPGDVLTVRASTRSSVGANHGYWWKIDLNPASEAAMAPTAASLAANPTIYELFDLAPAADQRLRLYPNPVAGPLRIEAPASLSAGRMRVFDLFGRVLFDRSISESTVIYDTAVLPSGTYMVRIDARDQYWIEQFVVR